jgi:Tfp pilus assembly protein PilX
MKSSMSQIIHDESGVTLAETAVAILIMTILFIGGMQFVSVGRERLAAEKYHRIALTQAESRLEAARLYSWETLADSLAESNSSVTLNNISATRTTVVTDIDDDYDGTGAADLDSNTVDYKHITVTITWASNQSLSLETYLSEYFYDVVL